MSSVIPGPANALACLSIQSYRVDLTLCKLADSAFCQRTDRVNVLTGTQQAKGNRRVVSGPLHNLAGFTDAQNIGQHSQDAVGHGGGSEIVKLFPLGSFGFSLLAMLFFTVATANAAPQYTQEMFRRGLYEPGVLMTTAPLFVLVTLRDPSSGAERVAAMPGPFLLRAIETEYRLRLRRTTSRDDIYKALAEQQQKEVQIALAQPNRIFVFRNRKARSNVEPGYSPAILTEVRHALIGRSRNEIVAAARANQSWLHQIYDSRHDPVQRLAYRDAVAHALLERGILVGHGDYINGLYVADKKA